MNTKKVTLMLNKEVFNNCSDLISNDLFLCYTNYTTKKIVLEKHDSYFVVSASAILKTATITEAKIVLIALKQANIKAVAFDREGYRMYLKREHLCSTDTKYFNEFKR